MWFSWNIAITNNSNSVYPWKIPFLIFNSAFSSCCQFHSPVFPGIPDKLYDFFGYLVHFETVYNPILRDHIVCLFIVNRRYSCIFFVSFSSPWGCVDQCIVALLFLWSPAVSFLFFAEQSAIYLLIVNPLPNLSRHLSYAPPAYECGTRPFLRWVLSQGWGPTRQAVRKMPRTPSAFPFSGRLRRRAINPTPPKRV